MAQIVDYASLKQALLDFTHRAQLGSYFDYFTQDAEDLIYRTVLELNEGQGLSWMEASLSGTIDANGHLAVPSDYLAMKGAQIDAAGGQFNLVMRDSQWIYANYPMRLAQGIPSFIAREQGNFIFGPFPDSSYAIVGTYFQRATGLSSTNTTTWMVTNIPLTLLAGCLYSASKFVKDAAAASAYLAELTQRLTGIIDADKANRMGNDLQIAPADPAPAGW